MSKKPILDSTTPSETFLNGARQYLLAADAVISLGEAAWMPCNFLLVHALELALKGFLRFHGESVPVSGKEGHDLVALAKACAARGLGAGRPGYGDELQPMTKRLQQEHDKHGFRYFLAESTTRPDARWLREILAEAMTAIEKAPPPLRTKSPSIAPGIGARTASTNVSAKAILKVSYRVDLKKPPV